MDIEAEAKALAREQILEAGRGLVSDLAGAVEAHDRSHCAFKERLWGRWFVPLSYYFKVWQACRDFGATITIDPEADEALVEVLVGFHTRACRVALEVYHLLRDGLPRAAMSRARTLYELAVYSELVLGEPRLAPRYLAYAEVQRSMDAADYNSSEGADGGNQFTADELATFNRRQDQAIKTHPGIDRLNGWASLDGKSQTFRNLVKSTSLSSQYPYYNWFSHEVHAGARGRILNTFPGPSGPVYLAGYTNVGLADPMQVAILCFMRVTDDLREACRDESNSETRIALHVLIDRVRTEAARVEEELLQEGLNQEISDIWERDSMS